MEDVKTDLTDGVTLVLGGARSGKSAFAEQLVVHSGRRPVYIATGRVWDDEMRMRVTAHRARRDHQWKTIEEPNELEAAITAVAQADHAILVDCLTLWLTNLMMSKANIDARCADLLAVSRDVACPVVFVSNEVGLGIVPDNKMARDFRDHVGRLHQDIAAVARRVYFVAAGLPLTMKG